jgi:putative hydrolase of the HAD superfamily
MFHTIFFDLDNTLYPADSGLWDAIGLRIESYLHEIMKMDGEEISKFRKSCLEKYGSTYQGLKKLYQIDDEAYMNYVHQVNLSDYLIKEKKLVQLLQSLPQRKLVFTNSDANHASRVLKHLEIDEFFDFIIDVNKLEPYVKPQQECYRKAFELAGYSSADGCVFIDDFLVNVQGAEEAGFFGVLVNHDPALNFHHQIADIYELPEVLKQNQERKQA